MGAYSDGRGDGAGVVTELFAGAAEMHADRVAVEHDGKSLTYRELEASALRVAGELSTRGVTAGDVVGICVARSLELPVAVVGALAAGAAYLPIDASYPRERQRFMLEHSGARHLIVDRASAGQLADLGVRELRIDEAMSATSGKRTRVSVSPNDLAYVLYTSGSTGTPKGATMTHGALHNLISWQRRRSRVGVGARTLQFSPLSFDVSFQELFSTWNEGGTIVMIDDARRRDPDELLRFLSTQGIHRLFLPFVALHHLAEAAARHPDLVLALQEVVTAGEQLQSSPALRALFTRLAGASLDNQYGPSETHVVSAFRLAPDPREWPALPPIGSPIDETYLHVLDDRLQAVDTGAAGELYIGGRAVGRGYIGQPGRTAERFVPDPFHGGRMYRTGDVARRLPDGNLEFIGRNDDQIKIRGYRIELGEVEAALMLHPQVAGAAVAARELPTGKSLVAYVRSASAVQGPQLRAFLATKLPDYMLPAAFVTVDAFPLTPSGKIDRNALPAPTEAAVPRAERDAPQTPREIELAALWREVLGVDQVSRNDNFFELGGHSLLAAQLANRASRLFGCKLTLQDVFVAPVLADQATHFAKTVAAPDPSQTASDAETIFALVKGLSRDEASRQLATWQPDPADDALELPFSKGALIRLSPDARRLLRILVREDQRDRDPSLPLRRHVRSDGRSRASQLQRMLWEQTRVWNASDIVPGRSWWGLVHCLSQRIRGRLDVDVLSRAVLEIQRVHEVLRARFRLDGDGVLWQQVADATPLAVEDHATIEDAHRRYDELFARFDLENEAPLKTRLLRLGPEDHVLVLLVHHVAFDAFSYGLLADALESLYAAGEAGEPIQLSDLPYQYADVAQRQAEIVARPVGIQQRRYWTDTLAGATGLGLQPLASDDPDDRPVALTLDERARTLLRAAVATTGRAAWEIAFHVFVRTAAQWFDRDSLVVINAYGARQREGADLLIGPLFRPLPIRIDGIRARDHRDALDLLQQTIAEARAHTDVLPPSSELSGLADLNVNYIPFNASSEAAASIRLGRLQCEGLTWAWVGDHFSKLKMLVFGKSADLDLLWTFDPHFLRRAQVEQIATLFESSFSSTLAGLGA